jgi:SNF2 family DNA or RNA helicase
MNPALKFFIKKSGWVKNALVDNADLGLQPYQQRVVRRISQPNQPGLVVAHGVGSGKTLSSIAAYNKLKMPTNVIVPAALRANYQKELNKWLGGQPRNLDILSQQAIARRGIEDVDKPNGLMIVDEAHRARERDSQLRQALMNSEAKKRLLLTGTPVFNHPKDISTLVNLAAGKTMLPENKYDFESQYVKQVPVQPNFVQRLMGVKPGVKPELTNTGGLAKILNKYVDYYKGSGSQGYPTRKDETVKVPMGQKQTDVYRAILGQAPRWVRWKVRAGLPPGRGELEPLRAFLSGARQVSNTNAGFIRNKQDLESAKIRTAFDYFKSHLATDPRYKAVVYSNYLNSGLSPYKQQLDQAGIPYGEFSGEISPRIRNDLVNKYNANKLKALLISSAGSEGLDLKGTRLVQILEPHFNEEKEKQIIGRAIRYKSHAALPPSEQNVLVQRYLAQPKAGLLDRILGRTTVRGTDEYIRNMALQKSLLNNEILKILEKQNQ